MTRMVAIGAVVGFAATIIVLSLWERSTAPTVITPPDAGSLMLLNPKLRGALRIGPPAVDQKVIFSPRPTGFEGEDAGTR